MRALPPETGSHSGYMKYWLGKIYEHYRGSPTRLIFLRLPRGGFVRPDQPRYNARSSVRDLSAQPNVTLVDEHFFDSLEKPELFADDLHLNGAGMVPFSLMLTQEAPIDPNHGPVIDRAEMQQYASAGPALRNREAAPVPDPWMKRCIADSAARALEAKRDGNAP